jgi:tetratricopeptide (TPR) repeat protein
MSARQSTRRVSRDRQPVRPREEQGRFLSTHPELRGLIWGVGIIAILSLGMFLAAPRRSKDPEGAAASGVPTPDAEVTRLRAAVARAPDDVDARLELARLHLRRKNLGEARRETREALRRAPENAQALTYEGLILLASGYPDSALHPLQRALARNPDLIETYLQLAYAYVRLDRMPEAEATIAAASARFPERAVSLRQLLEKLIRQTAEDRAADTGASPPARGQGRNEMAH